MITGSVVIVRNGQNFAFIELGRFVNGSIEKTSTEFEALLKIGFRYAALLLPFGHRDFLNVNIVSSLDDVIDATVSPTFLHHGVNARRTQFQLSFGVASRQDLLPCRHQSQSKVTIWVKRKSIVEFVI